MFMRTFYTISGFTKERDGLPFSNAILSIYQQAWRAMKLSQDLKRKSALVLVLFVLILIAGVFEQYFSIPNPQNKYIQAARLGSDWFLQQQNNDFLYYVYDPSDNTHPNLTTNQLRESGTLWAVATMGNYFHDARLTQLAQRGFAFFETYFKYDDTRKFYYVAITPDIKLGYSAFMILTLLQMNHPKKAEYLDGFARGITAEQNPDGSLRTFFFSDEVTNEEDYYPGEALFALMSLYESTHDSRYLATVERALPYYMNYWNTHPNTAFTAWQTESSVMLYDATYNPAIPPFVFSMSDYILNYYKPTGTCSGYNVQGSAALADYTEGIIAAYTLAHEVGDTKHADCYAHFIREAADYIVSEQLTDTEEFPPEAIGGFVTADDDTLRVDRNQHAVMALIEAYTAGVL
jgi:hypothetical protein